jgi:hypothetical protein
LNVTDEKSRIRIRKSVERIHKTASFLHETLNKMIFFIVKKAEKANQPVADDGTDKSSSSAENDKNLPNVPACLSPPKKRPRPDDSGQDGSLLSPEARQRMEAHRLSAKITRMSSKLSVISASIGPTWFQAVLWIRN